MAKENDMDSSFGLTIGTSMGIGLFLTASTLFLGWIGTQYKLNQQLLRWFILPVLGYGVTFGFNAGVQLLTCKSINFQQIASASAFTPGLVLLGLLLTLSGFVRSSIEMAVPLAARLQYGPVAAIAFYMFWAGMFGGALGGGFAMSC